MGSIAEPERVRKIRVFRNGDSNFFGKEIVVNPRQVRSYDTLLQTVTKQLGLVEAARSIRTPYTGTEIDCMEDLRDRCDYVAVGHGSFKKIGYANLEKNNQHVRVKQTSPMSERFLITRKRIAGRIYKENEPIVLNIYCNGEERVPAKRIVLSPRMMENWDWILSEINRRVNPQNGATRMLYTMDGELVRHRLSLQKGGHYVAVSGFTGFKNIDYGYTKPMFNVTPRITRKDLSNESRSVFSMFRLMSISDDTNSQATSANALSTQSEPPYFVGGHHGRTYNTLRPSHLQLITTDGRPVCRIKQRRNKKRRRRPVALSEEGGATAAGVTVENRGQFQQNSSSLRREIESDIDELETVNFKKEEESVKLEAEPVKKEDETVQEEDHTERNASRIDETEDENAKKYGWSVKSDIEQLGIRRSRQTPRSSFNREPENGNGDLEIRSPDNVEDSSRSRTYRKPQTSTVAEFKEKEEKHHEDTEPRHTMEAAVDEGETRSYYDRPPRPPSGEDRPPGDDDGVMKTYYDREPVLTDGESVGDVADRRTSRARSD